MQNTGTSIWRAANGFKLASQNPADNTTWGSNRRPLLADVWPGESATFTFNITAPTTPGTYDFQWQMLEEGVQSFGGLSANVAVNVQASPAGSLYYLHVDHLSTPRLVANAAGQTVWQWDQQEPFGNNVPEENPGGLGTFDLPLRLPGQYFDKETNLHYNYFRDYDPSIGRYGSSDPLGLAAGINTYAYVESNPTKYVDPLGLAKCYYSISLRVLICESDDGYSSEMMGPEGIFSGTGQCRNNPDCTNDKNRGPVPPGDYDMVASQKYGGSWWLSEGWFTRQMCKLGIGRCEFFLHEGTISFGCITIDRDNEQARQQFDNIRSMLRGDSNNTMHVSP